MFVRLQNSFPKKSPSRSPTTTPWPTRSKPAATCFSCRRSYEPCGLNQIYSLKYGTVPIVRATGGLDDTIEPWDAAHREGNRLQVHRLQRRSRLLLTIREAFRLSAIKLRGRLLMRNGMMKDFSWNASAKEYVRVYERVRQLQRCNRCLSPLRRQFSQGTPRQARCPAEVLVRIRIDLCTRREHSGCGIH